MSSGWVNISKFQVLLQLCLSVIVVQFCREATHHFTYVGQMHKHNNMLTWSQTNKAQWSVISSDNHAAGNLNLDLDSSSNVVVAA